jgi:hypothetical protein
VREDERRRRVRRSRVVLASVADAKPCGGFVGPTGRVKPSIREMTVAKRNSSPGRSRISRKTIAWGMPDVSGASAVNTRAHTKLPPARTRLRVHWAPGIPRALFLEGRTNLQTSGALRGENASLCLSSLTVESESEASTLGACAACALSSLALASSFPSLPPRAPASGGVETSKARSGVGANEVSAGVGGLSKHSERDYFAQPAPTRHIVRCAPDVPPPSELCSSRPHASLTLAGIGSRRPATTWSLRRPGRRELIRSGQPFATTQAKLASTRPSPSSSMAAWSPAWSHTVLTRLPVRTIWPRCRPRPSVER